jgi:hypothetical protein
VVKWAKWSVRVDAKGVDRSYHSEVKQLPCHDGQKTANRGT